MRPMYTIVHFDIRASMNYESPKEGYTHQEALLEPVTQASLCQ
jgi:hypothetical protein